MIEILLIIIAVIELARLGLVVRTFSKKRHFKNKLKGSRQMRWDLEFKVEQTKKIREDIRVEFDFMNSSVATIEKEIAEFKGEEGDKAKLEDRLVLAIRDRDRLLKQIASLDVEISGAEKSAKHPDGAQGILQTIDSIREIEGMVESWIKSI